VASGFAGYSQFHILPNCLTSKFTGLTRIFIISFVWFDLTNCATSKRHSNQIWVERMDNLDDWTQRISEGKIDGALQIEIADKILELLEQKKASLGTREKMLFAQAVTALSTSVNTIHQPAEAGLRRCLIALGEAMIPKNVLDESYAERDDEAKRISYAMLVSTVKIIRGQIV